MGRRGELSARPSAAPKESGSGVIFQEMSLSEKEQMFEKLHQRLIQELNGYYERRPKEWEELAEALCREQEGGS